MFDPKVLEERRAILDNVVQEDIWSLHYAAQHGKLERMETLLRREHTDINAPYQTNHRTALHYAVKHGQYEAAQLLLERDANVHMKDQVCCSKRRQSWTLPPTLGWQYALAFVCRVGYAQLLSIVVGLRRRNQNLQPKWFYGN